jgi:2-C-methyl-D-erythritol 2,4-cyclodiphosphate synthase
MIILKIEKFERFSMYRIGLGYDIHKLTEGRDLIIGGVKITHEKGLLGHSDADVLIHAIIDAMLGALCLSDIGTLFPDTDDIFKNIDSTILLKKVYSLIKDKKYVIENIDSNIIAQRPKMMPYIPKMREVLCKILEISQYRLSIKAKTNEKMDAVGQELAIEAQAVVLLKKV